MFNNYQFALDLFTDMKNSNYKRRKKGKELEMKVTVL